MKRKQAFLFWITGLSDGDNLAKKINSFVEKKFGPAVILRVII